MQSRSDDNSPGRGNLFAHWLISFRKETLAQGRLQSQGDHMQLLPSTELESQTSRDVRYRRYLPGFRTTPQIMKIICLTLHAGLVLVHGMLLGISFPHWEHKKVVPLDQASNWSTGLIIISQAFVTLYSAGTLVLTQQLALRRNLLEHQTLTATHDKSAAWSGLGSALLTLWRQLSYTASIAGVISVMSYLACISVLHVSTPALLTLETFNETIRTNLGTTSAYPNMTASGPMFDAVVQTSPILPMIAKIPQLPLTGLHGGTIYDILQDNHGIGNVTVNSTTFEVSCDALSNPVAVGNGSTMWYISEGLILTNLSNRPAPLQASTIAPNVIRMASVPNQGFFKVFDRDGLCVIPFVTLQDSGQPSDVNVSQITSSAKLTVYANGTYCYPGVKPIPGIKLQEIGMDGLGMNDQALFYSSVNFTDSQGNNGSRIRLNVPMIPDIFDNYAQDRSHIYSLQVMACRLSSRTKTTVVDAQTKVLVDPPPKKTSSTWGVYTPTEYKERIYPQPEEETWGNILSKVSTVLSSTKAALCDKDCGFLTSSEKFVIDQLGLKPDLDPYNTPQPRPVLELYQLENALANLTAALYWSTTQLNLDGDNIRILGSATVLQPQLASRFHLNLIPISVGLGASIILLIIATWLVWETGAEGETHAVDSAGILQLIWLLRDRPDLQKLISQVETPSVNDLRAAGMISVTLAGNQRERGETLGEYDNVEGIPKETTHCTGVE